MFVTRSTLRYYFFEQGKLLRVDQVVGFHYEILMLCWLLPLPHQFCPRFINVCYSLQLPIFLL